MSTRGQQHHSLFHTKQEFNYLLLLSQAIVNIFAIGRKKKQ